MTCEQRSQASLRGESGHSPGLSSLISNGGLTYRYRGYQVGAASGSGSAEGGHCPGESGLDLGGLQSVMQ